MELFSRLILLAEMMIKSLLMLISLPCRLRNVALLILRRKVMYISSLENSPQFTRKNKAAKYYLVNSNKL